MTPLTATYLATLVEAARRDLKASYGNPDFDVDAAVRIRRALHAAEYRLNQIGVEIAADPIEA